MFKVTATKFFTPSRIRSYSSALYITGDKAHKSFAFLTPHIEFEERIKERDHLIANIKARKLNIDVDKTAKLWKLFKLVESTKALLEMSKTEMGKEITKLMTHPQENNSELEKLKVQNKLLKNDLKNVKDYLYGLEEKTMNVVLSLPNILHERTPRDEQQKELTVYGKKVEGKCKNHLEIVEEKNLIQTFDFKFHFLVNDAALFEMAICEYFHDALLDLKFTPFSNSDFVRSVIVEGVSGKNVSNTDVITVDVDDEDKSDNLHKLHLVGGASLYSFSAYFTKHTVQMSYFPLKYFTVGRNYKSASKEKSLLESQQCSCVNIFVSTVDDDNLMNEQLDDLISKTVELYKQLGYHFRAVYLPALELEIHESLRLSIQMFSNNLNSYVEVAYISVCDNYVSKRLLFNYNDEKVRKYPKVLSGCLLNVHKLLACVIENNDLSGKKLLNDTLRKYVL